MYGPSCGVAILVLPAGLPGLHPSYTGQFETSHIASPDNPPVVTF